MVHGAFCMLHFAGKKETSSGFQMGRLTYFGPEGSKQIAAAPMLKLQRKRTPYVPVLGQWCGGLFCWTVVMGSQFVIPGTFTISCF